MSLPQLVRSVWHTRPTQLAHRARRIVRCRLHDWHPGREAVRIGGAPPPVCATPPRPLFGPRRDRVGHREGRLQAEFLNIAYPLQPPVDWAASQLVELQAMNLHYMEYLEALDDDWFARVVSDWIERNPAGVSGSWRVGWNSFVISLRTTVWMQQLALRRERLPPSLLDRMHASLAVQLRFLDRHLELDIGGNHLVKNAKALLLGARYFSGPETERWLDLGQSLLAAEIKEQVLPDGMHYELSPAYHLQVFADVLECVPLVEGRLEDDLRAVLSRMAEASVDLTHPDGAPSLFNDGGLHMAYPPEECLSVARSLGVSVPAPRHCFAFGSAGYFGRRDHGEYLLVDCGALGPDHLPAHGHGDALSFEWSIAGRRFIVDAGVLEYERGEWRYASRATVSHNTLTLDDADQHEFWAAFRVGRRARVTLERFEPGPEGFELEGCHDGFRKLGGSPLHRRHFVASRGRLQVTDEVRGGAGQCARARILLHPEVVAQVSGDHWTFRQGAETVALRTSGTVALEDAWWFPDFGIRTSTRRIVIDYGPAPSRGTFDLQRIGRS